MANYHVNYLTGSDVTGDGGTVNPWATIGYALTTTNASTGDIIKVVGSTTTDLTTTATFASNDVTRNITTGVDLTGSLAVGDTVIISPNMSDGAEFNGWMHTQVEAITSTVLTTTGYHMYPLQSTLSVTITKINDRITGNTAETISNAQLYTGAVVECGYNTAFTSVIGYTYWDNTTVGVAARSGSKFTISSSGSTGRWNSATPLFRNMGFIRYQYGMSMDFGAVAYANNIVILNGEARAGSTGFYAAPNTDSRTLLYVNDCDSSIFDKNYYQYAAQGSDNAIGNMAPMHVFVNQNRSRRMERQGGNIKDFTGWAKEGGVFGLAIPFNQSYNLNITGDIVMLGINESDITDGNQYYKASVLTSGTAQITPTSFKLVRNGRTAVTTPFNFISNGKDNAVAGNSYVKLPSGESLKDLYLIGVGAESNANTAMTWQDSNGIWTSADGTVFYKENLVDQDTGNSCLEVYTAPGTSYAASKTMPMIAAFPAGNAGLKLTGITFRYKKTGGSNFNFLIKTNIAGANDIYIGAFVINSSTYANATLSPFSDTSKRWIEGCAANTLIPIWGSSSSTLQGNLLIDSITPNYS